MRIIDSKAREIVRRGLVGDRLLVEVVVRIQAIVRVLMVLRPGVVPLRAILWRMDLERMLLRLVWVWELEEEERKRLGFFWNTVCVRSDKRLRCRVQRAIEIENTQIPFVVRRAQERCCFNQGSAPPPTASKNDVSK